MIVYTDDGPDGLSSSAPSRGRGHRVVAAALGLLLVIGVVVLGYALANQQGDPPAAPRATTVDPTASTAAPTSSPSAGSGAGTVTPSPPPAEDEGAGAPGGTDAPDVPGAPGPPDAPDAEALPASEPVSISIPGIGVESVVNPIGLAQDGSLAVPQGEQYDEAAWFTGSPTPGEIGPAVVEGHVTSDASTPSVFFDLGALGEGEEVTVTRADGTAVTFEVYRTRAYPKDAFPTGLVYGNTQGPELRLITCGGEYDAQAGRHLDNTVVYARMTGTTTPQG